MIVRRHWARQPQFSARANGDALAAGVRYIFNGAAAGPTLIGAPALTGNNFGLGPALNGSSQSVNTGQKFTSAQGTILLLTAGSVGTLGSQCMACQSSDDAGSGVGLGWQGGAFVVSSNQAVLAGSTGPLSGDRCFVGTWGPAGINGYIDGALLGTNAYTGAPTAPAGNFFFEIGCFRYSGGRLLFQQNTPAMLAVWDRQLSPRDVAKVSANPWQLFAPLQRRIWSGFGAAGPATHPSSGALAASAATVAGSAAHLTLHATSGALTAGSATVAGAALHPNFSTGALTADAAIVAGSAAHLTLHASSGALAAGAATVSGDATHTVPAGTHDTSGALAAGSAAISGTAAHFTLHDASGDLVASAAIVSGVALQGAVEDAIGHGAAEDMRRAAEEAADEEVLVLVIPIAHRRRH